MDCRSGRRESGQAVVLAIGGSFALIAGALALVAIAGAVTGKGRAQRAADLAAISAARSMRDDLPRLLSPPTPPERAAQPGPHGEVDLPPAGRSAALGRRRWRTGSPLSRLRVAFPDALSFAPVRVRTTVLADLDGTRAAGRGYGRSRSRRTGRARCPRCPRSPPAAATAARSPTARARGCGPTSPRLSTGWRRRRPRRRHRPDGQLGLPLRRRTGGAVRRQPRPALGRAAGPIAASLRDRARPRPRLRLRLARRQRRPVRLRPALLLGALALRIRQVPRALLGGGELGRGRRGTVALSPAAKACRASSRPDSGRRCRAPPHAGTSPRHCSPRS